MGSACVALMAIAMMPSTGESASNQCGVIGAASEEADADLEQLLYFRDDALVHGEHDDVVLGLDHDVVVRHDHLVVVSELAVASAGGPLVAPHDRPDRRAF